MTSNKYYIPSFVGGKIKGLSMTINNRASDVTLTTSHGVYYVYQGREFPLMTGDNITLSGFSERTISRELDPPFIPTEDIKLMISTGGLANCTIDVDIVWEVD